jgi:hypothetical protein
MALTEWNATRPAFDPVRETDAALARLPGLHREQARDFAQARFLARSPLAGLALMGFGAVALVLTGAGLKPGFGWAVMLLIAIIAMTRNYIRGAARTLRRVPLEEAAGDLRLLLLYSGGAWASGAWLLMPDLPAPALVFSFAIAPALAIALILKDDKGVMAFTAPAVIGTAAAAILGVWPLDIWVAIAICAAGFAIILLPALQQAKKNTPPGLTLR